uniref:Uncharacterized protein n=1 Tax=Oryza brachyantha TaxID=4533 RepID=J3MET5_ORYBR
MNVKFRQKRKLMTNETCCSFPRNKIKTTKSSSRKLQAVSCRRRRSRRGDLAVLEPVGGSVVGVREVVGGVHAEEDVVDEHGGRADAEAHVRRGAERAHQEEVGGDRHGRQPRHERHAVH